MFKTDSYVVFLIDLSTWNSQNQNKLNLELTWFTLQSRNFGMKLIQKENHTGDINGIQNTEIPKMIKL